MALAIPVGINPTTIGVTSAWWREAARLAESAGFSTVWAWDHFMSRGDPTDPALECWTTLTAAAVATERIGVGSWVTNVMNRHPSVLARIVATLHEASGGRVSLGIGAGGFRGEHERLGIDYPPPGERRARLAEAVAVLRLLFAGGPADYDGRFYQLRDAFAHPAATPPPRIVVAGQTPAGARLAARVGDAWTTDGPLFDGLIGHFEEALEASGRRRADVGIVLEISAPDDLGAIAEHWRERGVDELVIGWVKPDQLPAVLDAAGRAGSR